MLMPESTPRYITTDHTLSMCHQALGLADQTGDVSVTPVITDDQEAFWHEFLWRKEDDVVGLLEGEFADDEGNSDE
jgi:hypothetical protein